VSFKHLFSRSLTAAPDRLHFAAHSHHLWPDASHDGQMAAWADAAHMADHKWGIIMGSLWSEAQGHVASELALPDPSTISFSPNTHDFLVRIISAMDRPTLRILSTDGEFHSFRRQMARWVESGKIVWRQVPPDALAAEAARNEYDLIFASHVLFNSGNVVDFGPLAALAKPEGPWVVIDGYHGFMAVPTDLADVADRIFYLSGGYKYAMAGEGVCFLHAPTGFAPRPEITGWYAEFDDLALPAGSVGYAPDGRRFLGSTFDPSGLYRFCAIRSMLEIESLKTEVISAHVTRLQQQFLSAVHMPDMHLLNSMTDQPHARFLAFKGARAVQLHAELARRQVVTDVRGDVLRFGFGLYQDPDDVDKLTEILKTIG
jgi:selenocysteine lyase/cysteine desulfurase